LAASPSNELKVRADLAEVDRVRTFLRENLKDLEVTEEDAMRLELSLHEIVVNIALYAYPQGNGEMSVKIQHADGTLTLEIRDRGVPFDPTGQPPPDLEQTIRGTKRGGFGIVLFKSLMDGYAYKRDAGENILTVFKRI
jgi:anti-sigma regulatory factor (Ser/Thr protein kinase)